MNIITTNTTRHKRTTLTFTAFEETNHNKYKPLTQSYCFAFNTQGQLLIGRKPDNKKDTWMIPGGTIEPGETPEQTLHRELLEEVDAICDPIELFAIQHVHYPNNPNKEQTDNFYQARYAGLVKELREQTQDPDINKVWQRKYINIEELPQYIYWGDEALKLAQIAWKKVQAWLSVTKTKNDTQQGA